MARAGVGCAPSRGGNNVPSPADASARQTWAETLASRTSTPRRHRPRRFATRAPMAREHWLSDFPPTSRRLSGAAAAGPGLSDSPLPANRPLLAGPAGVPADGLGFVVLVVTAPRSGPGHPAAGRR